MKMISKYKEDLIVKNIEIGVTVLNKITSVIATIALMVGITIVIALLTHKF